MANEFFVRKGLAIATSSVATASGASQSTKYLVIGEDNIVRWASASSATQYLTTANVDSYIGDRLKPLDPVSNGFHFRKSINGSIGYIAYNSNSGNGAVAQNGVGIDPTDDYINNTYIAHFGNGYYISQLAGQGALISTKTLFVGAVGTGNIDFITGPSYASISSKFKILSNGQLQIVTTPATGSTSDSILVRDSSGNVKQVATTTITVASPAFSFQINDGNSTAGLTSFGVAQFSSSSLHFNNSSVYLSGTSSANNTLIGFGAGRSMTTGSSNTFMGASAGFAKTTGSRNTYIGDSAGSSNMIGSNNVFIGSSTGLRSGTGSNNTFIGAFVGTASIEYNNTIAIGSYASPTADNQLVIASSEYPIGTASSAVFSHFLNTKINGIDVKIPIYL